MALLRAALVDRDDRLQKDRSNLMQAQLKMQVRHPMSERRIPCDTS